MSYVIRNYGAAQDVPFRSGHITIQRDGCIVTNNLEEVNAFSGVPGISVVKQPGTVDVAPPAPEPVLEPIDYTKLLKRELLALAEERGLTVPSGATKADVIELLEEWDEQQAESEEEQQEEDEEVKEEEEEDEEDED